MSSSPTDSPAPPPLPLPQPQPISSSSLSPTDLRHITSSAHLANPRERKLSTRASQHLRTHRVGSRSPTSIPSSPTSVHSSSSAIFERDIEPLTPAASLSPASADPHRIPRARHTEPLAQSVPAVLDSAAAVLAGAPGGAADDDFDAVSVITPAPPDSGYRSGVASPISSRSPSPTAFGPARRTSLLFSASPPPPPPPGPLHAPPARPTVVTPPSAYYCAAASEAGSEASSPTTATHHEPAHGLPAATTITLPAASGGAHPPSPHAAAKRLSFMSYMDLLSSTPATTASLATVLANEPPHLPSVLGLPQAQYAASSSAGSVHAGSVMERDGAGQVADDVGGEWEREGLGRGLEERLEALNGPVPPPPAVSGRA